MALEMSLKISKKVAQLVRLRARFRCEYCLSSETVSGQACHVDHIIPRSLGGVTSADNMCLACAACNGAKLDRVNGVDPLTGMTVALYNPRTQSWRTHFRWSSDATQIEGLTPCGRATITVLKMNRPLLVSARSLWVSFHRHPPTDEE